MRLVLRTALIIGLLVYFITKELNAFKIGLFIDRLI